jgi:hypothetical protein
MNVYDLALFKWIDTYTQPFYVNYLYKYEIWLFPLLPLILGVLRKALYWRVIWGIVAVVVLSYLLIYGMIWYSWVAWPIAIATGMYCIAYGWFWYRIMAPQFRKNKTLKWLNRLSPTNMFDLYLRSDPRLVNYLDAVRRIRAEGGNKQGSFMASARMEDKDLVQDNHNIWLKLFRFSSRQIICTILKRFANRERMNSIESAFVIQRLELNRQRLWIAYASLRYGVEPDNPKGDPLENYSKLSAVYQDRALPPEFGHQSVRPCRIRWLACTEALAECYLFMSFPRNRKGVSKKKVPKLSPDYLKAAEILGQAGEVQHEIVCDLYQYRCDWEKKDADDWEKTSEGKSYKVEIGLTIHFLDLSARCLELWLEPNTMVKSLSQRCEHFCDEQALQNTVDKNDVLAYRIRKILFKRYSLIANLEHTLKGQQLRHDSEIGDSMENHKPKSITVFENPRLAFEAAMVQLTYSSAHASLWLQNRRGDVVCTPWLIDQADSAEPLLVLQKITDAAYALARKCGEPESRVRDAECHIRHLTGRAYEQGLHYLWQGDEAWEYQLQNALRWYFSADSSRIRRAYVIAQKTGGDSLTGEIHAHRDPYNAIVELPR